VLRIRGGKIERKERGREEKRYDAHTCVERSCYNLSVEFFDPASFHSPGGHFLLSSRISSRDRSTMHSSRFPDPASHPNFRSGAIAARVRVTSVTSRTTCVGSMLSDYLSLKSIHPISAFPIHQAANSSRQRDVTTLCIATRDIHFFFLSSTMERRQFGT